MLTNPQKSAVIIYRGEGLIELTITSINLNSSIAITCLASFLNMACTRTQIAFSLSTAVIITISTFYASFIRTIIKLAFVLIFPFYVISDINSITSAWLP